MIKLTLGQIINAEATLIKLDKLTKEEKFPFKITYKLVQLITKVQPELKDYYEQRDKILNKFGTQETITKKDEATGEDITAPTGQWEITPGHRENFKKYIEQLINIEVELVNFSSFTKEELDEVYGLSTDDIFALAPFILKSEQDDIKESRKKIEINLE